MFPGVSKEEWADVGVNAPEDLQKLTAARVSCAAMFYYLDGRRVAMIGRAVYGDTMFLYDEDAKVVHMFRSTDSGRSWEQIQYV